jgi:predicted transcriptional regulator
MQSVHLYGRNLDDYLDELLMTGRIEKIKDETLGEIYAITEEGEKFVREQDEVREILG